MGSQVGNSDLGEDALLVYESRVLSANNFGEDGPATSDKQCAKLDRVGNADKSRASSFGEKSIKHFLQERNILSMFNVSEIAEQEGFSDSQQLSGLIEMLIKDKRSEFTLGKVCTMKQAVLVRKYLEQGVDVNRPIEATYSGEFSGCSPLHLALSHLANPDDSQQKLLTACLLLHYGANVHAKDSQGNTPLHVLFSGAPFNKQLFDIIMKNGADNSAVNYRGETAFELLVASSASLDIENYMKLGGSINRFNSVNRQGCMAKIVGRVPAERIGSALSLMEVDGQGRTAIHNIVSFFESISTDSASDELYYDDVRAIIESILRQGGDINCQDQCGKTPLHYAATFRNSQSVCLLLRLGADLDVRDACGKSVLVSSLDRMDVSLEATMRGDSVIAIAMLMPHPYGLKIGGLLVSANSKEGLDRASADATPGALTLVHRRPTSVEPAADSLDRSVRCCSSNSHYFQVRLKDQLIDHLILTTARYSMRSRLDFNP